MGFYKKLISIGLILVLIGSLFFYGYQSRRVEKQNKTENVNDIESLKLWYTDDSLTEFFTKACVDFHEKNPDARVVPTLVSGSEYLEAINEASLADVNFPDLFVTTNDMLEKAYLAGLATNAVQKYSDEVLNTKHFSQVALDAVTYKKHYVGYPLFFETSLLAYNKTYLEDWVNKINSGEASLEHAEDENSESETEAEEKPKEHVTLDTFIPGNIDDILEFADPYNAPAGVDAIFKWDVSDIFYNYFFVGNYMIVGGNTGDNVANIDIYNADTIKCMEVYQNLNQFFSIDADDSKYADVLEDFMDGKCVFTIITTDALKTISEHSAKAREEADEARRLAVAEDISLGAAPGEQEANTETTESSTSTDEASDDDEDEDSNEDESKEEEAPLSELHKKADELEAKCFDFGYARIPMINETLLSRSLSVTNAIAINGYSMHKDVANEFAAFVTTECADELYMRSGKVSASLDAVYDDPNLKLFQCEYAESIPLPKIIEASNFWVQLEITFTKIWEGEDVQTYIQNLSDTILRETEEAQK